MAAIVTAQVISASEVTDVIHVSQTDLLHGSLVEISEEAIIFESTIAGTVILPLDEVEAITTAGPCHIMLIDGRQAHGMLLHIDGVPTIAPEDGSAAIPIALSEVLTLTPLAHALPFVDGDIGNLAVDLGPSLTPYPMMTLSREESALEYESRFYLGLLQDEDYPSYARAMDRIAPPGSELGSSTILAEWNREASDTFELRSNLSLSIRGAKNDELRDRGPESPEVGEETVEPLSLELSIPRNTLVVPRWSAYYRQDSHESEAAPANHLPPPYGPGVFKPGRLSNALTLQRNPTRLGEYTARSQSAIEWRLSSQLGLKLNVNLDFESDPAWLEDDRWRSTVGAGIVVKF
jgi:hypothetical protein